MLELMKRSNMDRGIVFGITLAVLLLSVTAAFASDKVADWIFTNGKVYTVDAANPWAQAIVIKDGRFVYVGDNAGTQQWTGPDTEKTNLDGKLVLPGIIDSHVHVGLTALLSSVTVMPVTQETTIPYTSREDTLKWLKGYANDHPDQPAIVAGFWRRSDFGSLGPNRSELDAVVSDRPVALLEQWGHSWWLNSKAIELLGASRDLRDPVPGLSLFVRDAEGELTGFAKEFAAYPLVRRLFKLNADAQPEQNKSRFESNLLTILDYLTSKGVTSLFDAGNLDYEDEVYSGLAKLEKEGRLLVRVEGSYHIFLPDHFDVAVSELKRLQETYGGEKLTFNTIKMHFDGISHIHTAAMVDPYSDRLSERGTTLSSETKLTDFMRELHHEKIDLHIHVIGDRASQVALNAYENVTREIGRQPDSRLTLCHLFVMKDEDLPRFKRLGVIANFTPHWHGFEKSLYLEPTLGERSNISWRSQPLFDDGAVVTFSSDLYLLHALERANPFIGMQVAHNRQDLDGGKDAPILPPLSERLSLENLIEGYTLNGAFQLRADQQLGSIQVGKIADLVILKDNIFKMDRYDIHKTEVDMTIVKGKVIYQEK